ncbi:ATP-binding protein [Paenibacillus sp. 1001270B_150601_E10]|uniref:ATP-binding protein n=1 Tax=Paenibacillus sp. 1001270B_150601_E10 TaxID=2787079 RepID=UPI00189D8A3E|nr:ATP-binding protein [Paenibacillus sp. 1001270B_150601_E10]
MIHQQFYNQLKADSIATWGEITARMVGLRSDNEAEIMKVLAGRSKKHDSSGIGFALAKAIIEAHQALIKVESEKHVYIAFTLPLSSSSFV